VVADDQEVSRSKRDLVVEWILSKKNAYLAGALYLVFSAAEVCRVWMAKMAYGLPMVTIAR